VTVLATDATGLAVQDVFYVGNAVGESGDTAANAIVNATDEILARNNPSSPFNPAQIDNPYDYNRDKLVNATDQIVVRNNRTSPFTALKLITPPLEDDGGGEGEGEWSGDVWMWTDRSPFESSMTRRSVAVAESLAARLITGAGLPHVPALAELAQQGSSTPTSQEAKWLRDELLIQNAVDSLFTLPMSASAMTAFCALDASSQPLPSRRGGTYRFTPPATDWLEGERALEALSRPLSADDPARSWASSQDAEGDQCPVGPLRDDHPPHDMIRRFQWAADARGAHAHRALDEALRELLAEWEQH